MAISLGAVSSGVAVASQEMGVEQEEHRASCQRRATPSPFTPKSPSRRPQWRQAALSQGLMALSFKPHAPVELVVPLTKNPVSRWLAHTGPGDGIYSCSEMRPEGKQP